MTLRRAVLVAVAALACSERRELPDAQPCEGSACEVRLHEPGILDRTSDEHHGRVLQRDGSDFAVCQRCHGDDFAGGITGVSCLTCHADGPTTCETCHGPEGLEPMTTGAHSAHLAAALACSECHVTPDRWDAPGHILGDAPPAEVTFGARAQLTPPNAMRGAPATWDGRGCTNVYCHGDVSPSFGGMATKPRWSGAGPAFTCDRCHGAPPPDHLRVDCVSCHPFATATHADGTVDIFGAP